MSDTQPPDKCPECGNEDIDVRTDIAIYEWNWTCHDCMHGDYQLKEQHRT